MTQNTPNHVSDARWALAIASVERKSAYITAHPDSDYGNPNFADTVGYELCAIRPNGQMIYRRKPWYRRIFQGRSNAR